MTLVTCLEMMEETDLFHSKMELQERSQDGTKDSHTLITLRPGPKIKLPSDPLASQLGPESEWQSSRTPEEAVTAGAAVLRPPTCKVISCPIRPTTPGPRSWTKGVN
ncbi:hypothetical protein NDU88_007325 [Pleurodeles waltl]|uniref:Uncharacterized protein n=1 Tax=Pleurodeles waltl TaxID=8319 RepID=A0AAV7RTR7_PLEWA|nr:hypothetical protein NDU88_007325 [Pleurodeles waltl]